MFREGIYVVYGKDGINPGNGGAGGRGGYGGIPGTSTIIGLKDQPSVTTISYSGTFILTESKELVTVFSNCSTYLSILQKLEQQAKVALVEMEHSTEIS